VAEEYLRELNPDARLEVFGQELNDESYAICKSDMMIKGQNPANIARGNSFSGEGHAGERFDYMLSNPPFGVEWKKVEKAVRDEAEQHGHSGRFGAGLPRIKTVSYWHRAASRPGTSCEAPDPTVGPPREVSAGVMASARCCAARRSLLGRPQHLPTRTRPARATDHTV